MCILSKKVIIFPQNNVSLEQCLLGTMSPFEQCLPWNNVSLEQCPLEQCLRGTVSPWTKVSLEHCLLGTKSPWNSVPWNSVPWNNVPWNSVPWNNVPWNNVATPVFPLIRPSVSSYWALNIATLGCLDFIMNACTLCLNNVWPDLCLASLSTEVLSC